MKLFKAGITFVLIALSASSSFAVSLKEALEVAYAENEDFKLARTKFLKETEKLPQAVSGFLPNVQAQLGTQTQTTKSSNIQGSDKTDVNSSSISITQPIFSGWSSVASMSSAKKSVLAALARYYSEEQSAALKGIQTYLSLYSAHSKLDILDASLRLNEKQYEATSEKLKLGESTRTDLAAAKASRALARAKYLEAQATCEKAKAEFTRFFSISADSVPLPPAPDNLPVIFEEFERIASEKDFSLSFSKNQYASAKSAVRAQKGALMPQVNFSFTQSSNLTNGDLRTSAGTQIQGRSRNSSAVGGVSMTIPIYGSGGITYSRIREAKIDMRSSAIALDAARKANKSTSITIWKAFMAAKSSIAATKEAVEAAKLAYEGMKEEELLGSKNLIDVLKAEEDLSQYKLRQVDEQQNYILRGYEMKFHMGTLTAQEMNLDVEFFNPQKEMNRAKRKIFGY